MNCFKCRKLIKFFCYLLISLTQAVPNPKQINQDYITPRELDDLSSGTETEKDDSQGSFSVGYGYYSHPYLGGGYYGGYYPFYNGIYGLGKTILK